MTPGGDVIENEPEQQARGAFEDARTPRRTRARVEQKNWTHVRQLVGYGRLGDPA